jgi:hypothetical protein
MRQIFGVSDFKEQLLHNLYNDIYYLFFLSGRKIVNGDVLVNNLQCAYARHFSKFKGSSDNSGYTTLH